MEIKHTNIEGNPLVNRVELHHKGDHFLVVAGNYDPIERSAVVSYRSLRFETLEEAVADYNHRVNMYPYFIPLSAAQFERCNDLIHTCDFKTFYFESEGEYSEIINRTYLEDIRGVYGCY